MADIVGPSAIRTAEAPLRARASGYPADLAARVAGREKRPLGDLFGLGVFGVNLTRLAPGAWSALHHRHSRQDEFVDVLEGTPMLVTDAGATLLSPAMCARLSRLWHGAPPGEPQRRRRGDPGGRRPHAWRRRLLSGGRPEGRDGAGRQVLYTRKDGSPL